MHLGYMFFRQIFCGPKHGQSYFAPEPATLHEDPGLGAAREIQNGFFLEIGVTDTIAIGIKSVSREMLLSLPIQTQ